MIVAWQPRDVRTINAAHSPSTGFSYFPCLHPPMGCCNSTANIPSSNVVGESVPASPVTVATSHPLATEHSSDTLYRPRGRALSAHHPTYRNTARSHPTPRNRMLSASQEMNSAGLKSSMKAQTSLRPSNGSRSGPRHTNPGESDA